MDNFKVYRNGQYSHIDNLKIKAREKATDIAIKIDDFFVNH